MVEALEIGLVIVIASVCGALLYIVHDAQQRLRQHGGDVSAHDGSSSDPDSNSNDPPGGHHLRFTCAGIPCLTSQKAAQYTSHQQYTGHLRGRVSIVRSAIPDRR